MVENLEICGLEQSKLDPYIFIGDNVIAGMYVDNILMWSTDDTHIIDPAQMLNKEGVDQEEENDAAGFIGVKMTNTSRGMTVMTQEELVDRTVETIGLNVASSHIMSH